MSGAAGAEWTWVLKVSEIAREAGARLREFLAAGVETEYKGDVDLVTIADRTVEKLILERLGAAFPEHGIYGEEGTRERMEGEYRWYVDPLDGTTNFAHGFPHFCVSLGLEHRPAGLKADEDGHLVAAVIYDPNRDELFTAERGKGAWLNGKPIHVSRTPELAEALVATGFPEPKAARQPEYSLLSGVHSALARSKAGRFGGAGPGVCCLRTPGCILGVQAESVGYGGGVSAGGGSGRAVHGLRGRAVPAGQPGGSGVERTDSRGIAGLFQGYVCGAGSVADSDAEGVCRAAARRGQQGKAMQRGKFRNGNGRRDHFPGSWVGRTRFGEG